MEKAIGTRQGHGPEAPSGYPSPPPARPPEHTPEFPEEQGKARTPFPVLHGLPGSPSETLQYMLRKVLFIYNPSSGESPVAGRFDRIIELYQAHGLHMLFHRLAFDAGDEAVLAAVDGSFDHLLLAGGDGSINYAVNLIKGMGLNLPVAVLPAGTANDFATLLGMRPTSKRHAGRYSQDAFTPWTSDGQTAATSRMSSVAVSSPTYPRKRRPHGKTTSAK